MTEQKNENQSTVSDTELAGELTRKLFVGGLSWQTTEDGLQRYLESQGMEVERVLIMRDKLTGRSRGFGFVILKQIEMLDKAVSATLQLDGRKIEAKRAIPKRDMEKSSRKLFVGGIPISLTPADFKKFFEQFGTVSEAQVMTERDSGRSRGFGFVTFNDDETVEKVLATQHNIQGKPVEVKRAEPKKADKQTRPIILPIPAYFSPAGYPYSVAYASPSGVNNPTAAMYGQALTYDPAGYFVASPMYAPQFLPIDDPAGSPVVYDQYYYDSPTQSPPPVPASPPVSSSSSSSGNSGKSGRLSRRDVSGTKGYSTLEASPTSPTAPSGALSLVDRVRVAQNEVRKKRGMSTPEPERVRKSAVTASGAANSNMPARRSVVTMNTAGNWRSRATSPNTASTTTTTTTATTSTTTTTPKEGGALHKYFQ